MVVSDVSRKSRLDFHQQILNKKDLIFLEGGNAVSCMTQQKKTDVVYRLQWSTNILRYVSRCDCATVRTETAIRRLVIVYQLLEYSSPLPVLRKKDMLATPRRAHDVPGPGHRHEILREGEIDDPNSASIREGTILAMWSAHAS